MTYVLNPQTLARLYETETIDERVADAKSYYGDCEVIEHGNGIYEIQCPYQGKTSSLWLQVA